MSAASMVDTGKCRQATPSNMGEHPTGKCHQVIRNNTAAHLVRIFPQASSNTDSTDRHRGKIPTNTDPANNRGYG